MEYKKLPNPFTQIKRAYSWFESVLSSKKRDHRVVIEGQEMEGHAIMWGDMGVMLFTPYNKRIIYTDASVRENVINTLPNWLQ